MSKASHSGGWVILASALLALVLTVALPALLEAWRPPWLLLVTICWVLALPERIGVGMAWAGGLLLDVVQGLPLGAHALAFALVAWLTMKLHRRLPDLPPMATGDDRPAADPAGAGAAVLGGGGHRRPHAGVVALVAGVDRHGGLAADLPWAARDAPTFRCALSGCRPGGRVEPGAP
ncbi:MAG: rod shape-determining protein MreD [Arhodomonas sp.]|nr:rod shape-determining protein MreD [Arhodomonas sp.]